MITDTSVDTLEGWLHTWGRPGYQFTPLQLIAYEAAQRLRKRTFQEWAQSANLHRRDPNDLRETPDTDPLTLTEAALFAGISTNDRSVGAEEALRLVYGHLNKLDIYLAARDPMYPRDKDQLSRLAAFVRGELAAPAGNGTGTDG